MKYTLEVTPQMLMFLTMQTFLTVHHSGHIKNMIIVSIYHTALMELQARQNIKEDQYHEHSLAAKLCKRFGHSEVDIAACNGNIP